MTYSTPCITFSAFSNLHIQLHTALQYDFLFPCSARVPEEQSQVWIPPWMGTEKGREEPPSDLILDIPVIQVNCNNQKPQLQLKSLSTSRCPSMNIYAQFGNHKKAVSSWTLLRWILQKTLLSIF